jgi:hypothetical protein
MLKLTEQQKIEARNFLAGLEETEGFACECEQCEELREAIKEEKTQDGGN